VGAGEFWPKHGPVRRQERYLANAGGATAGVNHDQISMTLTNDADMHGEVLATLQHASVLAAKDVTTVSEGVTPSLACAASYNTGG
jgi:hypothetical protein